MNDEENTTRMLAGRCPEHNRCFGTINAKLDAILAKLSAHSGSLKMDHYRLNLHEKLLFGAAGAVLAAFMGGVIYLVLQRGGQP